MNAAKLQVKTPLVELDGDEMTRIIWALIKQKLILPYLDIQLEYYDLGVENRDKTDDRVTVDAAHAIARRGVGVKCATITPDVERVKEYSLKKAWPSPNATIRSILDGTVFRKPIVVSSIAPAVRSWRKPIVIGRHAYGDIYKAVDFIVPGPGTVELVYKPSALSGPSSASPPSTASSASSLSAGASHDQVNSQKSFEVYTFTGPGVVMGMHNTDASIASFAKACVNYALSEKLDIWFAAKDTISKVYHGRFRELFAQEVQARAKEMEAAGIHYRYMLIDDAVAQLMKSEGGMLWACMNYDGDVFSDMVASGFGSLGMMSSVLVSPSGAFEYEAAHGTVRRHYQEYLKGNPTSTNPVASIFAWSGALRKRGELDQTPAVCAFADELEAAVIELVESGVGTKDLVSLMTGKAEAAQDVNVQAPSALAALAASAAPFETTESFMDKIAAALQARFAARFAPDSAKSSGTASASHPAPHPASRPGGTADGK